MQMTNKLNSAVLKKYEKTLFLSHYPFYKKVCGLFSVI